MTLYELTKLPAVIARYPTRRLGNLSIARRIPPDNPRRSGLDPTPTHPTAGIFGFPPLSGIDLAKRVAR